MSGISARLVEFLKSASLWHLLWMSIVASEILAAIVVSCMSLVVHGKIMPDYILTGFVTDFITCLAVVSVIVFLVKTIREKEKELLDSEAQYHALVDLSPLGIAVHRLGEILFVNKAGCEILGAKSEVEAAGVPLTQMFYPEHEILQEAPADTPPRSSTRELKIARLDGEVMDVEVSTVSIVYHGQPSALSIFRDISQRKFIEDALREAKEKAEEATTLKDKFVSLVAHDLKSPVTAISGFLRLLESDPQNQLHSSQRKIIDTVLNSADHMIRIIDDLLNVNLIRAGKIVPRPVFTDVQALCAASAINLSFMAEKKGVRVVNKIDPGVKMYADPVLLETVIKNLLSNAIKFSNKDNTVTIFTVDDPMSCIAIKDEGTGITEDFLPNIFKHEIKTTSSGTGGEKGTGLGLPHCHDIVSAHGGELTFETAKGAGATFYVRLPKIKPRILLVEDEEMMRIILKGVLENEGMEVTAAENGARAVEKIDGKNFHLVVSDIFMPEMDGFQLLERLRSDPETVKIPFLAITADYRADTRNKAFRLGAADYVTKPVAMEDFLPRVKRLIG